MVNFFNGLIKKSLEKELEKKGDISDMRFDFRKGRSMIKRVDRAVNNASDLNQRVARSLQ